MTQRLSPFKQRLVLVLVGSLLWLGLALVIFAPVVANAAAATFVRPDGDDTNCDGTANVAYPGAGGPGLACAKQTIQAGVNVVDAGGTVSVAAGTYTGAVAINKSLTLVGQGATTTILDGVANTGQGISLSGGLNGVSIKQLGVTRYQDGITLPTGPLNNILLEDVESVSNSRHGIHVQAFGLTDFTARRVNASNNITGGSRGIWIINGVKTNISIEDGTFKNNGLVGIDISDGSVTGLKISGNTVTGNGDAGIGVLGAQGPGANLVANNTVTNNGRYGIEIKVPNGNGADSGGGSIVVSRNSVQRTIAATDAHDYAGIAVFRRSGNAAINADQPTGLVVSENEVSGFLRKPVGATGDGFGIVVEGTNHTVKNNKVTNNDVGIQVQGGNTANTQSTDFFDRGDGGNASVVASFNSISGNGIGARAVKAGVATVTFDAKNNWWGSQSGPTNAGNPGGTGDSVVGDVAFSPWLCDGTDTSAAIGFQPNTTTKCAVATRLVFSTQPGSALANQPLSPQPVVRAEDNDGNLAINFSGPVTLAIGTNPGGGTLSGTVTVNAVNGAATFSGLSIDKPGMGYTLVASATGLTPATSQPFNISIPLCTTTCYADANTGSDANGGTSPADAKKTIQAAINQVSPGGTVIVAAGTYPENLLINKPVTVKGAGVGVLAKGRAGAQSILLSSNSANPVDIQADNVTLDGFVLDSKAAVGRPWIIVALSGPGDGRYANTKILNNEFIGNPGNNTFPGGAYLQDHDDALIEGNYFNDLGQHAIFMAGSSTKTVYRNNDSLGNFNSNFSTHLGPHTGALVENNRATDDDMILFSLADSVIKNNTVTSTGANVARIFLAGNDQRITITDNTLNGQRSTAILVSDLGFYPGTNNSDVTITRNTVNHDVSLMAGGNFSLIDLRSVRGTNLVSENKVNISGTFTAGSGATSVYAIGLRGNLDTVNVTNNELKGGGVTGTGAPAPSGVLIRSVSGTTLLSASAKINATNNLITGFVNGVAVYDDVANQYGNLPAGASVKFNLNSLSGNSDFGFRSGPGAKADATKNWWGSSTGPTNAANPGGTGTKVSDNVDFVPWLCSGTDISPATGFQPNPNTVCGPAAKLVFSTQPGGAQVNQPLVPQPVVQVQDNFGNVVTSFNGPVTLAIANNPGGGTLNGTATVNAVNGVATFSGLSISQPGSGYTLKATSGSLTPAISQPFNITPVPVFTCAHPTLAQLSAYRPLGDNNGNQNASYPLKNLIDESNLPNDQTSLGTFWAWTNYPRAVALQVDYGTGQLRTVNAFKIFSHDPSKAPNVYFQFSQNGTTWFDIPGLNNLNVNQAYQEVTYSVNPAITARLFRVVIENTTFLNDVGYWADFKVCTSNVTGTPSGPTPNVSHALRITGVSGTAGTNGSSLNNLIDGKSWTNWLVGNKPSSANVVVNLGASRTITSLSYFQTNSAVARKTKIEYWNGASWVTIPGLGSVNTGDYSNYGNNVINLNTPITTNQIRFTISNPNNEQALGGYGDIKVFGY